MSLEQVLIANAYTSPHSGVNQLIISTGPPGITADATTGINVGGGVAVYGGKIGDELQFRTFITGSNKMTVAKAGDNITHDVVEANMNVAAMIGGTNIVYLNDSQTLTNKTFSDSVRIGSAGTPNIYAVLDLASTTKAMIYPSLSAIAKLNIAAPVAGMAIFNSSTKRFEGYNGNSWAPFNRPRYTECYITTPVATTITTVNTYYKVAGITTEGFSSEDCAMSDNNRLLYNGTIPRVFKMDATLTATVAAGNKTLEFIIFKNGSTPINSTAQTVFLTTNRDNNTSLTAFLNVVSGDYFEVWVKNLDDNTNTTISTMNFNIHTVD